MNRTKGVKSPLKGAKKGPWKGPKKGLWKGMKKGFKKSPWKGRKGMVGKGAPKKAVQREHTFNLPNRRLAGPKSGRRMSRDTTAKELRGELTDQQTKTFTAWLNKHLSLVHEDPILDLYSDLADGVRLAGVVTILAGKPIPGIDPKPRMRVHKMGNAQAVLNFLRQDESVRGIMASASDVVDGNKRMILGLLWLLILHYQMSKGNHGTKAKMLEWIRGQLEPYGDSYRAANISTSFQDGRLFCALIHSVHPDAIDMKRVEAGDPLSNLEYAFSTAEGLGIARLMEPEDFIVARVDELSVMTYMSGFMEVLASDEPDAPPAPPAPVFELVMPTEDGDMDKLREMLSLKEKDSVLTHVQSMKDEAASASSQLDEAKAEAEQLQSRIDKLEATAAAQGEQREQEHEDVTELRAELERTRAELAKAQAELAEARGESAEAQGELSEARGELAEAQAALTQVRSELATVTEAKHALEQEAEATAKGGNALMDTQRAQMKELRGKYASLQERMASVEPKLALLDTMLDKQRVLQLERQELQHENDLLSRKITRITLQMPLYLRQGRALVQPPTGDVTLVFTDVQGSTVQWERDAPSMAQAIATHNDLIRNQLEKYNGYEVKTEGDAFMVAFASPVDAARCCLDTQLVLMEADWPEFIYGNENSSIVRASDGSLLYRGLRVRMGIHWGQPTPTEDPITGRMDYFGQMVNRSARVESVCHGGQILVSGDAWNAGIGDALAELGDPLHRHLGSFALKGLREDTEMWEMKPRAVAERTFPAINPNKVAQERKALQDELTQTRAENERLQARLSALQHSSTRIEDEAKELHGKLSAVQRGGSDDVAVVSALEELDALLLSHADVLATLERAQAQQSSLRDQLEAHDARASAEQGKGQKAMSPEASARLAAMMKAMADIRREQAAAHAENVRITAKLKELSLKVPLYMQNPGADVEPPTGDVTLVFTDVQGSTVQWERTPDAMAHAIQQHNDLMRQLLLKFGGYEVKTEGDAFMIAFSDTWTAVQWCLATQEDLLHVEWDEKLLHNPESCVEKDSDGQLIYRGLRVRMGVHFGTPRHQKDPITGRMDYFGPMVNRSARVESVAAGGQLVVSKPVMDVISKPLNAMPAQGRPRVQDLGAHNMKGLSSATHLYDVTPMSLLSRTFPAIDTANATETAKVAKLSDEINRLQSENDALLERLAEMDRMASEVSAKADALLMEMETSQVKLVPRSEMEHMRLEMGAVVASQADLVTKLHEARTENDRMQRTMLAMDAKARKLAKAMANAGPVEHPIQRLESERELRLQAKRNELEVRGADVDAMAPSARWRILLQALEGKHQHLMTMTDSLADMHQFDVHSDFEVALHAFLGLLSSCAACIDAPAQQQSAIVAHAPVSVQGSRLVRCWESYQDKQSLTNVDRSDLRLIERRFISISPLFHRALDEAVECVSAAKPALDDTHGHIDKLAQLLSQHFVSSHASSSASRSELVELMIVQQRQIRASCMGKIQYFDTRAFSSAVDELLSVTALTALRETKPHWKKQLVLHISPLGTDANALVTQVLRKKNAARLTRVRSGFCIMVDLLVRIAQHDVTL